MSSQVGVAIETSIKGLSRLQSRLNALVDMDRRSLLEGIGAEVESQTKRRIASDKTAPDGSAWDPWSDRYKKTRHSGQSLLQSEGHLLTSIQFLVGPSLLEVEVGSNLVYARAHQLGFEDIPQREYLGLSGQDEDDVLGLVEDFVDKVLGGDSE